MNFLDRIALPVSHSFWIVVFLFLFVSRYLLISSLISLQTHSLFINILFKFHIFVYFPVFFLWVISSFIALWSDKMLYMISNLVNLVRLVLCPNIWSILENISCALENYAYSAVLGWNTLKIQLNWYELVCHLGPLCPCWFSLKDHWSHLGVKIPYYDCISVDLSFYVHQVLLYIFRCSCVGSTNVY